MNIKIIGVAYPFRGGLSDMNEKLFYELEKKGHNVEIINFKLLYPSFLFPGKSQYSESTKPKNLKTKEIINSINPFNWIRVGLYLRKQNIDLIIIKYWLPFFSPCFGTILRILKKKNIKIVSIIDNIIPHEKRFFDNIFNKYFVGIIDKFITLSKNVYEDLSYFTKKTKIYTPHPTYNIFGDKIEKNIARKFLGWDYNDKYVLFFGLIRKYKGLDLLIDALSDKRLKELNVKLYIAGEFYENEDIYINQIKRLGLENQVIINNKFIPKEEVKYYFCASDITAQTYHSATQSGITQISYHFEKPTIVSNVGGLAEIVNENTGYVVEKDPQKIADAILDYYKNNKNDFFSKNIKEDNKKYSWDIFIKKIVE